MTNREQRIIIAQETMNIVKQGFYQNQQGEVVNIQDTCLAAKKSSIHYSAVIVQGVELSAGNKDGAGFPCRAARQA
ncbi:MAG TPA: hypothetical protein DEV81_19625 [Cyanobacteria bacterium UBA11049]|nr:hypothetical protein [Cyanobacteria bacterium UBA11049]